MKKDVTDLEETVTQDVNNLEENKQNKLTPGPHIRIVDDVIWAEGADSPFTPEETETLEEVAQEITENPVKVVNPESFYRFKNLIDNSSFEVFDGQTLEPYGWTGGTVSAEASMFGTHSMKVEQGDTAMIISKNQPDVTWAKNAYDTDDLILSFYHKFGGVEVSVYDIVNSSYLYLQKLDNSLEEIGSPAQTIQFDYKANWNMYRDYIKIAPKSTTKKVRVEFYCPSTGTREVYIDAVSLEPYVEGEFPSIYKDGRYSISAYQVMNPPPRRCRQIHITRTF